jgi:predicted aspartyl protease
MRSFPLLCSACLALAQPVFAQAQTTETPDVSSAEQFDLELGRRDTRMTVPVSIGGEGPFDFVIDTGAERTVISTGLAQRLRLQPGRDVTLHSMGGARMVPTVVIPSLALSSRRVTDIQAPALQEAFLGAKGMLGVDSLQSQRVTFDFRNGTMSVVPSRAAPRTSSRDMIVVTARSRFGRLVLVDAKLDGQKVWVVIDTGSQVTVGNSVLREKLRKRGKLAPVIPVELISVTGDKVAADYTRADELVLDNMTMTDMPIAFADIPPFEKLDLEDKPALLLGMDALQAFSVVSVDFAQRKVRFRMPDAALRQERLEIARR